jgi:hypothetical protein
VIAAAVAVPLVILVLAALYFAHRRKAGKSQNSLIIANDIYSSEETMRAIEGMASSGVTLKRPEQMYDRVSAKNTGALDIYEYGSAENGAYVSAAASTLMQANPAYGVQDVAIVNSSVMQTNMAYTSPESYEQASAARTAYDQVINEAYEANTAEDERTRTGRTGTMASVAVSDADGHSTVYEVPLEDEDGGDVKAFSYEALPERPQYTPTASGTTNL